MLSGSKRASIFLVVFVAFEWLLIWKGFFLVGVVARLPVSEFLALHEYPFVLFHALLQDVLLFRYEHFDIITACDTIAGAQANLSLLHDLLFLVTIGVAAFSEAVLSLCSWALAAFSL
jgi:hypothetical protein